MVTKNQEKSENIEAPLIEESVSTEEKIEEHSPETKTVGQGVYGKIKREISENDLTNPVVGKLILAELDDLKQENSILVEYRSKYYEMDKKCAVLESKSSGENKFQILYTFCLSIGGLIAGLAFSVTDLVAKIVLIISGFLLLVVGTILSYFLNKK